MAEFKNGTQNKWGPVRNGGNNWNIGHDHRDSPKLVDQIFRDKTTKTCELIFTASASARSQRSSSCEKPSFQTKAMMRMNSIRLCCRAVSSMHQHHVHHQCAALPTRYAYGCPTLRRITPAVDHPFHFDFIERFYGHVWDVKSFTISRLTIYLN